MTDIPETRDKDPISMPLNNNFKCLSHLTSNNTTNFKDMSMV